MVVGRWSLAIAFCAIAASTLTACNTSDPLSPPTGRGVAVSLPAQLAPSSMFTIDDEFAEIADSVPGFGGLYFDQSGSLTVVMQEPQSFSTQLSRLERAIARTKARRHGSKHSRDLEISGARVVAGAFSFRQLLSEYRGPLLHALPNIVGLVSTDIDEVRNRIVVGILTDANVTDARRVLVEMGVTSSMVDIVQSSAPTSNSLLADPLRPVPGGARIKTSVYPSWKPCTLGFNLLKYMGTFEDTVATGRYFVTASHCSSTQWSLDYSQNFQGGSFAATEVGDYYGFSGAPCTAGKVCRYSEASLYKYYADSITSDDGRVAFPTSIGDTSFTSYKTITSTDSPYTGMSVHMIGATSGRRSGNVTASCIDVYNVSGWGNKGLLCQCKASYFGTNGDSGAPVITLYGDGTVSATGLHWGNVTQNGTFQYSYFSPMYSVLYDFFYNIPGAQNFSPVVY